MEKYQFTTEQRSVLESMQIPFAFYQFIDKRVVTLVLSRGFCDLFGYENIDDAYYDMDNNMYKDTHPDDVARIAGAAYAFATKGGQYDVVYRTRIPGGTDYHLVHATGTHVYVDGDVRLSQISYIDEGIYTGEGDISSMDLSKALSGALGRGKFAQDNPYDILTGLPGMNYFFELAEAGAAAIRKDGDTPAMLFLDMEGMKNFNQKFGYEEGDRLLCAMAKALAEEFSSENCCHVVADHFAAFTKASGIESRLLSFFETAKHMNGGRNLPVRVGIYLSDDPNIPVSTAIDRAKIACDSYESAVSSEYVYFNYRMAEESEHRHYIVENFQRALDNKWIKVYFQPIVRAISGRVCEEEALSRWIDPEKGLLRPNEFIPILEESKLIYKLDLYVLENVISKIKAQEAEGLFVVPQSINLSRSDFEMCDIVEEVRQRVDDSGIRRDLITIEVTESILEQDFEYMKEQLSRFKALGFSVWMDDFGSGYSSLDVLQSVDFDLIKFDKSFMDRLDDSSKGKILINELMRLAKALDADTLCEGVETEEQLRFLKEIGCSKLQGYYFIQPIPLEAVFERYRKGLQIGYEDPRESAYYETVGRLNIYDLSFIAKGSENELKNVFDTLPIAIMEKREDEVRYIRSNQAYHEFTRKMAGSDIALESRDFGRMDPAITTEFTEKLAAIKKVGDSSFIREKTPDGLTINSFIKCIAFNEIKNKAAIAIAVLSVTNE